MSSRTKQTIYVAIRDYDMITEIDIDNGYNRIPLHEDSQQFTAFTQPSNGMRWMFTVLIYGIEGASGLLPEAFSSTHYGALHLNNKVYLDNDYIHTLLSEPESSVAEKATHHAKAVQASPPSTPPRRLEGKKSPNAGSLLSPSGCWGSPPPEKPPVQWTRTKVVDLSDKGRPKTQKAAGLAARHSSTTCATFIPSYDRNPGPSQVPASTQEDHRGAVAFIGRPRLHWRMLLRY